MIPRKVSFEIVEALDRQAAVANIGPRQAGKTILALEILDEIPRVPKLFQSLRGLIEQGRRRGKRPDAF